MQTVARGFHYNGVDVMILKDNEWANEDHRAQQLQENLSALGRNVTCPF